MKGHKLSEKLRAAIERDVSDIDEDTKKKPGKLATDEPEHFVDCPNCRGTGLDGDVLCANCAGSGKVLGS